MSMTATQQPRTRACWPTARPRTANCLRRSSVWRGCSTSRCGRMAAGSHRSKLDFVQALRRERATRNELSTVVDISFDAARHEALDLSSSLSDVPLKVHARYQREQILAALDFPRMPNSMREGVWYSSDLNIDCFLVTLKKSEADYSPSTMYADYPISPTLFHWESQSTTSVESTTGQRYLNGFERRLTVCSS